MSAIKNKRVFGLIGLSFISSSFTFITPLLSPFLILYLKLSEQKASFMMAGIFLLTGLIQPFIGVLLDRQYYKMMTVISSLLFTAGVMMMVFKINSITFFVLGVVTIILGFKMIHVILDKCLMTGLKGDEKGEVYLWHYLSFNLGFFCASILAFKFLEQSRETLFFLDWLSTLGVGFVCYLILAKDHIKEKTNEKKELVDYKLLIRHSRRFLGIALIWILIFSHTMIVPLLYNYVGLDPLKWTLYLLAMNTAGATILGLVTKRFFKRISEKVLLSFGCLLLALGYAMIPLYINLVGITVCTLLIILGEVMVVAPQTNLLYRCFSEDNIGLASGLNSVISSIGKFLCPCLSFILFNYAYNIKLNFSLIFGVSVPCLIVLLLWPYLRSKSNQV